MIFDTLRAKASLIVACNRRLAFVGETRFMLNKHEANRLWRFYGLSSLHAEQARCESPMAIKGSKNSKKRTGDNINLGVSPQYYNPSRISEDNLDTSSKSIIHQKSAACTVIFDTLRAKYGLIAACGRRPCFAG